MITEFDGYRPYLKNVLAQRQRKNAAYSMRAFAKTLGLSQSAVSQVFAGKKNLSLDSAQKIAQSLQLSDRDAEYFSLLVQFESSKQAESKKTLWKKLQSYHPKTNRYEVGLEGFRAISEWWHIPIRNMTELNIDMTGTSLSERLGITRLEAELALDRLLRLQLIEPDPRRPARYRKTVASMVAASTSPNEALRNFHRQMLKKASEALETQSPQEKMIGSETIAINKRYLPEAEAIAEEFFQKILALEEKSKTKTDVYHLGVQFFNLTPQKRK